MESVETKLRETVKKLFAEKKIDLMIGYEKGTLPLRSRPILIRSADEADKLVWNATCSNNLAIYLLRLFEKQPQQKKDVEPPKVGIIAKGCDMLSLVGLLREKQAPRENIVIVGVPCTGMVDRTKIDAITDGDIITGSEEDSGDSFFATTLSGQKIKVKKEDVVPAACLECRFPVPEEVDVLIDGDSRATAGKTYGSVTEFESMSQEERWQYFMEEISKCIRCYACRQACPNCYCKECFADQTKPRWVGAGTDMSDIMFYHIGRIFHQAGRCVGCDACVRACPMDIDLRTFTQKLVKDAEELYGYTPGFSAEELPLLCTFRDDDSQNFITEP